MFGIDTLQYLRNTTTYDYVSSLPLTNLSSCIMMNVLYLVALFLLKKYMDKREAFHPKKFMLFYNAVCVCLAAYCFFGMLFYYYMTGKPLTCQSVDFNSPSAKTIAHIVYVYYIQKYWEYLDTIIFILRKSYRQVTFLHVYHHTSVTIMARLFLMSYPNGDNAIMVLANCFIHILMYTHYFCSVLKMKCWWRSYLTQLQLVQFLLITYVHSTDLIKGNCQNPHWMNWLMIGYMVTMIVLFSQFYIKRYLGTDKPKQA